MVDLRPSALITGITGQDGSYLAELLCDKGYEVHGLIRRSSGFATGRIEHLFEDPHMPDPQVRLHYGDMLDYSSLSRLVEELQPDEVYNLAAQSHVRVSFRHARVHRPDDHERHHQPARGDPPLGPRHPLLPGREQRDVRQRAGAPPERAHGLPPSQPLRGRQGRRARDDQGLPRGLRRLRLQRHPLQPRVAPPRPHLRHPQDHPRHRADPARRQRRPLPRQPRRQPRLGLRARVHGSRLADAPSRTSRTTTSSPAARRTPCASSSRRAFAHAALEVEAHVRFDAHYLRPAGGRPSARRRLEGASGPRLAAAHGASTSWCG